MRIIAFLLLMALSQTSLSAQSEASQNENTDSEQSIQLREENQDLKLKIALAERNTEWLEIERSNLSTYLTVFAVLISIMVLFFTLRLQKVAIAEAKTGIAKEREEVRSLLETARETVKELSDHQQTAKAVLMNIPVNEVPQDPKRREFLRKVAAIGLEKSVRDRSIDDYRAIIKADFMDERWLEMERHSRQMQILFEENCDEECRMFAQFNLIYAVGKQGRREEAIELGEDFAREFSDSEHDETAIAAAAALYNVAVDQRSLRRHEEAAATNQRAIAICLGRKALPFKRRIVACEINRAVCLGEMDKINEELHTYECVIRDYGANADPAIREYVGKAYFNIACVRGLEGKVVKTIEALENWSEYIGNFHCEKIADEDNFDLVRDRPRFANFLKGRGCTC